MALPSPRRWWALVVLALCVLIVDVDITILNIAAPTLAVDLGADTADLQWIIDAYIVVLAVLLLPLGLLGDRVGRKRVLLAGMALFAVGSLLAAAAGDIGVLIAARAFMGAGAAAVMPLSMSMLPVIFPPQQRSRAMTIWAAAMVAGLPLGPLLGGFLLDHFWWGSVFLLNIPVLAVALPAAWMLFPESRERGGTRFQPGPTAAVMIGLAAVVYAVIEMPRLGWSSPVVWLMLLLGVGLLAAFTVNQLRCAAPMVDLGLFRDRTFLWGSMAATYLSAAFTGAIFVLPQYLQVIRGDSTVVAGVHLLPLLGGSMLASLINEQVSRRIGLRTTVAVGLLFLALGCGLGATTSPDSGVPFLALWTIPVGFGMVLALVPAMGAVLGALPADRAGAGSGLVSALRQVGSALGVAVLGSILSTIYIRQLDTSGLSTADSAAAGESIAQARQVAERTGDPHLFAGAADAFTDGMNTVLVICAAAAAITALTCLVFLPGRLAPAAGPPQSEDDLARTA